MTASAHLRANAKVNLALAVAPANEPPPAGDGLHPIASWFCAIDLCDELTVTRLDADRASRYAIMWHDEAPRRTPIDWSVSKDLAVKAHAALEAAVGRRLPVQMKLEKRIPVGAGLAGGSSDAAAMLRAVCDVYDLGLSDDRLRAIGATVGSDVAFFLDDADVPTPRPAFVSGVGEIVERTADIAGPGGDAVTLVLVLPGFGCSTPGVYRAFDELGPGEFRSGRVRELARRGVLDTGELFNDLARPAEIVEPRLGELRGELSAALGAPVHVTGSGSGLFIAPIGDAAESVARMRAVCERHDCAVRRVRVL